MTRDFTMEKYRELCQALLSVGFQPNTVYGYLAGGAHGSTRSAIFRHDIDRKIENALRMAELEAELGIVASYYFRYPSTFDIEVIRDIRDLGHEIGYHYEVLSKTRGDFERAIDLFSRELAEFRTVYDVKTICMHGRPLSRFDNRDLWSRYDYRSFGILGEAYLSMSGQEIRYLTDTGRNWGERHSLRDTHVGVGMSVPVETTADLIEWLERDPGGPLYMTAHPERWSVGGREYFQNLAWDHIANLGKILLLRVY